MPMTIEYKTAQMYSHMIQHAQTYKCCQFLHQKKYRSRFHIVVYTVHLYLVCIVGTIFSKSRYL